MNKEKFRQKYKIVFDVAFKAMIVEGGLYNYSLGKTIGYTKARDYALDMIPCVKERKQIQIREALEDLKAKWKADLLKTLEERGIEYEEL